MKSLFSLIIFIVGVTHLFPTYSQSFRPIDICPNTLIIEKGDTDCTSSTQIFPANKVAGKTLRLLESSRVVELEMGASQINSYMCNCDYGIIPEEQEEIVCSTGERYESTTIDYFFDVVNFRWIEPPLNSSTACEVFKNRYGYSEEPFFTQTDFDFFSGVLRNSFQGIASSEKAVVMGSPYIDGRYFTKDFLYDQITASFEALENRAVSYDNCESDVQSSISLFDLNPQTYNGNFSSLPEVLGVESPLQLSNVLQKVVNGTTSDGESKILLSVSGTVNTSVSIELDPKYGSIEFPWGNDIFTFAQGANFYIAVYTPPKIYPEESESLTFQGAEYTNIELDFTVYQDDAPTGNFSHVLPLIRPPVVLVHGTYDNPENCWKTGLTESANGLYQELSSQGFKVFTCDYTSSNGTSDGNFQTRCGSSENSFFTARVNDLWSSFECNKNIVYENPGGIRDAIRYYRDSLNVACTQVDAIGHSMGGVLLRVYASDRDDQAFYSYDTDYYRPDNFEQGDINRLITLASTHHGSDAAWLAREVYNNSIRFGLTDWLTTLMPVTLPTLSWLAAWSKYNGATIDQVPESAALRRIGPTPIPSHAMVFYVNEMEDIKQASIGDYGTAVVTTMALYFQESLTENICKKLGLEWDRLPDHLKTPSTTYYDSYTKEYLDTIITDLDRFVELYRAPLESNYEAFYCVPKAIVNNALPTFESQSVAVLQYETAESSINDFDNDEHQNFIDRRVDLFEDEYVLNSSKVDFEEFDELVNKIRFLIFKNDLNDGTVRYLSQAGGLEHTPYMSEFPESVHSYAPRYPDAIIKISALLKSGMEQFAPEGFPNAGRKLPIWLPDMNTESDIITGCEAACWSGMVPDHALAWAKVADEKDVIILNRPVNPDATPLIYNNASTKGMTLKGKSSNWGPQKGLITADQRFSKIWKLYSGAERDEQVKEFDEKVAKLIKSSPGVVQKIQLKKEFGQKEFLTWIAKGEDAEQIIRFSNLKGDSVYTWRADLPKEKPFVECESDCNVNELDTFFVLANPNDSLAELNGGDYPAYTADYDLLAIGFSDRALFNNPNHPYDPPLFQPPEDNFDCEIGIMTGEQKKLLNLLNQSVHHTGYKGGNVAHHGPENQFSNMSFTRFHCDGSFKPKEITANPYFDYPITAFEPDDDHRSTKGVVRTIRMGPPGYKDINLKRYIAEKRRQGFNIYANPNSPSWEWEYWRPYSYQEGFDDRDYPELPSYPEELPRPNLQACLDAYGCGDIASKRTKSERQVLQRPPIRVKANQTAVAYPNPAGDEPIWLVVRRDTAEPISISVIDEMGRTYHTLSANASAGINKYLLDTQSLESGLYLIRISGASELQTLKVIIQK